MTAEIGSLILFTPKVERVVAFYREIGIPLEEERHEDGLLHFACELGPVHFAVFAAESGSAPDWRTGGSAYFGIAVASIDDAFTGARRANAPIIQEPQEYPWGMRALVLDPDGRVVELFERPAAPA